MIPTLHQVVGFVVGMITLVTSRVKNADLISGPKALRDLREIGRFPSIATAVPKAGVSWLVESGSESDLVFKAMLRDINAQNCRAAQHPISLITANGSTEANEVADVKLSALPDPVQPYVLNQTPAVLSVGTRCVDQGYSSVWRQVVNPFLFVLTEKSSSSRLKVMSQFWMTHAKSSQRNGFRRTSISRNCSQCRPRSRALALRVRKRRMKTSWMSSSQMMPATSTSGEGRRRISLAKQPVLSISSRTFQSILPAELASVQG